MRPRGCRRWQRGLARRWRRGLARWWRVRVSRRRRARPPAVCVLHDRWLLCCRGAGREVQQCQRPAGWLALWEDFAALLHSAPGGSRGGCRGRVLVAAELSSRGAATLACGSGVLAARWCPVGGGGIRHSFAAATAASTSMSL